MTNAKDPLRYFRVEAREISEELGRGVLQIEKEATPELVARMLRLAHTLKGAASVVKQRAIADHMHALEDALAPLRERSGKVPRDAIDPIIAHVDAIAAQVAALEPAAADPAARPPDDPSDEPFGNLRADVAEMDALLDGISEASVQIRGIRGTIGLVEQARHLADLLADRTAPQAPGRYRSQEGPASEKTRQFAQDLQGSCRGASSRSSKMPSIRASVRSSRRATPPSGFACCRAASFPRRSNAPRAISRNRSANRPSST